MSRSILNVRSWFTEDNAGVRGLRRGRNNARLLEGLESRVLMSGSPAPLGGAGHHEKKGGGGVPAITNHPPVEGWTGAISTPASVGSSLTIDYNALLSAAHARDADGDPISFTVTNVSDAGTLTITHNGTTGAVVAGTTTVAAGDTLGWTPAAGHGGKRYAFSVLAGDGKSSAANAAAIFTTTQELPKVTAVATRCNALEQFAGSATGNGEVTLIRSGDTSQPLTVTLNVAGTAQMGVNYTLVGPDGSTISSATPTVTFAANQNTLKLTIAPIQDNHADPTLTVLVTVAADPNTSTPSYRVGDGLHSAQVKIIDGSPTVSAETGRSEASATRPGSIVINRTGDTSTALTVNLTTATGTGFGTQGTDFVLKDALGNVVTNSFTVPSGQHCATIFVFALNSGAKGRLNAKLSLTAGSGYQVNGHGCSVSASVRLIIGANTTPPTPPTDNGAPTIANPEVDTFTSVNTPMLLAFDDLVNMAGAALGSATGPLQLKVTATFDGTLQIKHGADSPIAATVGTLVSEGDFLLWSPPNGATSDGMSAFTLAAHAGTLDSTATSLFKVAVAFST